MSNYMRKGIERTWLRHHWDTEGLTPEQKRAVDAGLHPLMWLPMPLGVLLTGYMAEVLSFISGKDTQEVLETFRVLNGTAGAGSSVMPLARSFHHVTAGDSSEEQLKFLRHNIRAVMGFPKDRVQIDSVAQNIFDRKDLGQYQAILLKPYWGGVAYSKAGVGELDLYISKTAYNEASWKNVCALKQGAKTKLSPYKPVDTEHFIPLHEAVIKFMSENKNLLVIAIVLPFNYNIQGFYDKLKEANLTFFVCDPCELHPPQISAKDFGARPGDLSTSLIDTLQKSLAYPNYRGSDRYPVVMRTEQMMHAMSKSVWDKTKSLSQMQRAYASRWGLLWDSYLRRLAEHARRKPHVAEPATRKPHESRIKLLPAKPNLAGGAAITSMCAACNLPMMMMMSGPSSAQSMVVYTGCRGHVHYADDAAREAAYEHLKGVMVENWMKYEVNEDYYEDYFDEDGHEDSGGDDDSGGHNDEDDVRDAYGHYLT